MKKNVIRLTETEFKKLIKESVKQTLNEINEKKYLHESYNSYETLNIIVDLSEVDLNEIISETLFENGINDNEVNVTLYFENTPNDRGGSGLLYVECDVDTDNKFKGVLSNELYDEFVEAVSNYVEYNSDDYAEIAQDEMYYNSYKEYDPDDYKD